MGSTARGLKVNNPGNLRSSLDVFEGQKLISSDGSFKEFDSLDYGYRAMAIIIYNYVTKYGSDTIRKIITRYAPPTDGNNTESYIATVANMVNASPDRVITEADFTYPAASPFMRNVVGSMTKIETGSDPNAPELASGYQMFINDRLV